MSGKPGNESDATLWAISDLHVKMRGNEVILPQIRSNNPADWLIVAGDVSENIDDVIEVLQTLTQRFAQVIWTPGNHELYTSKQDAVQLFGVQRYDYYIDMGTIRTEEP